MAWRCSLRRRWCAADLASLCARLSISGLVGIQPGHKLVTSGVYGIIRHPSYLGLLISSLGWALAFRSGVGVLLTALLIPPLFARIRAEETLLCTQFGAEYEAYCSRTSRLIPGVLIRAAVEVEGWSDGFAETPRPAAIYLVKSWPGFHIDVR